MLLQQSRALLLLMPFGDFAFFVAPAAQTKVEGKKGSSSARAGSEVLDIHDTGAVSLRSLETLAGSRLMKKNSVMRNLKEFLDHDVRRPSHHHTRSQLVQPANARVSQTVRSLASEYLQSA